MASNIYSIDVALENNHAIKACDSLTIMQVNSLLSF